MSEKKHKTIGRCYLPGLDAETFADELKRIIDTVPWELKLRRDGHLKMNMKEAEVTPKGKAFLVSCPVWHRFEGESNSYDSPLIEFEVRQPNPKRISFWGECIEPLFDDVWDAIITGIYAEYPPAQYQQTDGAAPMQAPLRTPTKGKPGRTVSPAYLAAWRQIQKGITPADAFQNYLKGFPNGGVNDRASRRAFDAAMDRLDKKVTESTD